MSLRRLLVALLAVTLLGACASGPERRRRALGTGRLPLLLEERPRLQLGDLQGRPLDLRALAAGQVLVVDVWASWCASCRFSLPAFDALAERLGPRGLRFVGVSVDEDRAKVEEFLRKHPVRYPIAWDRGAESLSKSLDIARLPVTLVIDRRGTVRFVHDPFAGPSTVEAIEQQVNELLAEAGGPEAR